MIAYKRFELRKAFSTVAFYLKSQPRVLRGIWITKGVQNTYSEGLYLSPDSTVIAPSEASFVFSLSLIFLICKMGITISPLLKCYQDKMRKWIQNCFAKR